MKKRLLKLFAVCLIIMSIIYLSCQKETETSGQNEVQFVINPKIISQLKSTKTNELTDAKKVIITIETSEGLSTDYSQYELILHKIGSDFITKKIALTFGNYQVTEFYVLDALDSIIYASPIEGSLMAQNIEDPLPINFTVDAKESIAISVEVISTANLKPQDFGLVQFPLIEVETFQFLVSVSELGTSNLLISDLTITSGTYQYLQTLDSIVDNIITLKDGYTEYILKAEVTGFKQFVDTFLIDELKNYDNLPLIIELENLAGLKAHYPFNSNAFDVSGNGIDGTIVGTVNFNNDVQFDKGITPNIGMAGSGVDIPTTIVDSEKGCIEFWAEFYYIPVAYSYGVYGFVNSGHWSHNVLALYWHNDNSVLAFDITFNGTGQGISFTGFSPDLYSPVHIAAVWDRNGINSSGDYLQLYVDGTLILSNTTDNTWGNDNTSGDFRIATPWDSSFAIDRYALDNMKIWDYAKTDFSDRFTE